MTTEAIEARLKWLSEIEPGWHDGEGEKPSKLALHIVRYLLLPGKPFMMCPSDEGIVVENDELILEVFNDGRLEIVMMSDDNDVDELGRRIDNQAQ